MNRESYKVCIRCWTYNQSSYIEQALDGFASQETTFPYVCCIVDDASTDNTSQVISSYIYRLFDIKNTESFGIEITNSPSIIFARHKTNKNCYFVAVFLRENLYSQRKDYLKFEYIKPWRQACRYEAICEGDDFWVDSKKLAKQIEILDSSPNVSLVYARANILNQASGEIIGVTGKKVDGFENLLFNNNICTLTTCFPVSLADEYQKQFTRVSIEHNWKLGDYPLWLWLALNGDCVFIDEAVAVYRQLPESASHTKNIRSLIDFQFNVLDVVLYFSEFKNISKKIRRAVTGKYMLSIFRIAFVNKDIIAILKYLSISNLYAVLIYFLYRLKK